MLLGAQFCSDSFSSISLDAVKDGASYSFYARQGHLRLFFRLQSIPTQCTLLYMFALSLLFLHLHIFSWGT